MEERGVDETVEQFEERILNKRAGHLYNTIRMRISTEVNTTFTDLIVANPKKQVRFVSDLHEWIYHDGILIRFIVSGRTKILFFAGVEKTQGFRIDPRRTLRCYNLNQRTKFRRSKIIIILVKI